MTDTHIPSPFECRHVLLNKECTAKNITPVNDIDRDGRAEAVVVYECLSFQTMSFIPGEMGPVPCIRQYTVLTHNAASDRLSTRLASLALPNGVTIKPLQGIRIEGRQYLVSAIRVQHVPAKIEIELTANHPPVKSLDNEYRKICTESQCTTIPTSMQLQEPWEIATLTITDDQFSLVENPAWSPDRPPFEKRTLQGKARDLQLQIVP